MIDEATVDCYDEYEEFAGILATLEDRLEFPFQAKVRKRGRQYTIALADLEALEQDTKTVDWLAAYRYWLGK
jgi:hypothetical protein